MVCGSRVPALPLSPSCAVVAGRNWYRPFMWGTGKLLEKIAVSAAAPLPGDTAVKEVTAAKVSTQADSDRIEKIRQAQTMAREFDEEER